MVHRRFSENTSSLSGPSLTSGEASERGDQDAEAGARGGAEAGHAADGRARGDHAEQEAVEGEEGVGGQGAYKETVEIQSVD